MARRKKTALVFPLQALSWYVNTMQTLNGKNMDHRVVMRLCQVLTECGPLPAAPDAAHALTQETLGALGETRARNTYAALFNDSETALFARIAADSIDAVGTHLALFYHSQNARTIFSPSCALVEKLRKCHARSATPGAASPVQ